MHAPLDSPRAGTCNAPRRIGGFSDVLEALAYAAEVPGQTLSWFDGHGRLQQTLSYAQLQSDMEHFAGQLLQRANAGAAQPGSRCGILAATGPQFITAFCACLRLGWVPCPLPMPHFLQDMPSYAGALAKMQHAAGIRLLLGPQALVSLLDADPALALQCLSFEALAEAGSAAPALPPRQCRPEAIAYVQFSSGSTSAPKGIAISHRALMHNVDAILHHGMALTLQDRALSWLPYYHDMGLVGFVLAPLCAQVSVDYLSVSAFTRRPQIWPALLAQRQISITYAPAFAWQLAAQHVAALPPGCDLRALRIAGVGGERVEYAALQAFATAYAACGFEPNAFKPSYGLAEATLAVAMSHAPFAQLQQCSRIDANGQVHASAADDAQARAWVECGKPLPGWKVTVRSPGAADGPALPPCTEGEIYLRGPSLLSGQWVDGQLQPHRPGLALATGDLGFVRADGTLTITGRCKDLIIVRGRNLWPQDVEFQVGARTGLPAEQMLLLQDGRADRQGALVLLVQEKSLRKLSPDPLALMQQAAQAAAAAAGGVVHVCMVANGSILHTSSGKTARAPTRQHFESGQMPILASNSPAYPSPFQTITTV